MKLTPGQQEKAIALRGLIVKQRPTGENSWIGWVDFTRSLAVLLDGVEELQTPHQIKRAFDSAWSSYIRFWGAEHDRILCEALGNDEAMVMRVKGHRNGHRIVTRILERVKKTYGGISSEVNGTTIEVTDILTEEIGEDWTEDL